MFTGEVAEFHEARSGATDNPTVWVFDVITVHKGEAFARQPVVTAADGAACGLEIPEEGTFVVFATSATDGITTAELEPGFLASNLCSGTRSVADEPFTLGDTIEPSDATDDGLVITEMTITMQLVELGEDVLDVIQGIRAARMACSAPKAKLP